MLALFGQFYVLTSLSTLSHAPRAHPQDSDPLYSTLPKMRASIFSAITVLLPLAQAEPVIFDQLKRVHIYSQHLSNTVPSPLASIDYNTSSLESKVLSYFPQAVSETTNEPQTSHPLLRISTDSADSSTTITSLSTFNPTYTQTLSLHLNGDGVVFAASFSADPLNPPPPTSNDPIQHLKVVLVEPNLGPTPKLNSRKPVVVGADGKEIPQVPEVEKSFFQKYWWAFALVAVLALSGGGDK